MRNFQSWSLYSTSSDAAQVYEEHEYHESYPLSKEFSHSFLGVQFAAWHHHHTTALQSESSEKTEKNCKGLPAFFS